MRLSPPPPFTEYDDGTKNNTNTANNYPIQNNDDWQAEKWDNDSPFNVNKAELAVELGNLVNEGVLSLATRNKLLIKSDDAAIPAAIASGDVDYIATAANISPAEAEALLSRLAAKKGSKAAGSASANKSLGDTLKNIGYQHKGAAENIRTVSKSEFEQLKNNLLQGATKLPKDQNYPGTLYQLPNGQGQVGIRMSKSGETLDFRYVSGLENGFKIHQQ